jgi:tetratricopeptide (TPR) repeat protein|tara:strand:- start:247 stop:1206 length:960 start_codon:yes stop_codon:yes gene_type:complete
MATTTNAMMATTKTTSSKFTQQQQKQQKMRSLASSGALISPISKRKQHVIFMNASEVAESAVATEEFYEVTLPKPIDVKFARGNDGGAYVAFVPPNDPKYEVFEIGDKIEGVSASFGDEVWPAESFGQVMYAMKNRNGDIYLKMKKMFGDFSAMEVEKNSQFKSERAGGNYGAGTKEQQMNNYSKKRELENERLDMFDEAIALYNQKNFDDALIQFEEVAALEPKNYMSDNFETTTEIYRVCQYNIACCFSNIGKLDESLLALRRCMASGWTDYRKIRTDPSLKNVRASPEFTPLMNKFDEPIFNENAAKFLGNLFGKK